MTNRIDLGAAASRRAGLVSSSRTELGGINVSEDVFYILSDDFFGAYLTGPGQSECLEPGCFF